MHDSSCSPHTPRSPVPRLLWISEKSFARHEGRIGVHSGPMEPGLSGNFHTIGCCTLRRTTFLFLVCQFDTLPVAVSGPEEMKPGDLVFVSGNYFNQQRKQQRHGMVHVEIWLGEGEKTVGARWQKGR